MVRDHHKNRTRNEGHKMVEHMPARSPSPTTPHQVNHMQTRSRTLFSLLGAASVFAAAMYISWTLDPAGGRQNAERDDSALAVVRQSNPTVGIVLHTTDCANPHTAPALHRVDLVEYFSLQAGEPAVTGKSEHAAVHGGYRFLFSSAANKALFEVGRYTERGRSALEEWACSCGQERAGKMTFLHGWPSPPRK